MLFNPCLGDHGVHISPKAFLNHLQQSTSPTCYDTIITSIDMPSNTNNQSWDSERKLNDMIAADVDELCFLESEIFKTIGINRLCNVIWRP